MSAKSTYSTDAWGVEVCIVGSLGFVRTEDRLYVRVMGSRMLAVERPDSNAAPSSPEHGTMREYAKGCRCNKCRSASTDRRAANVLGKPMCGTTNAYRAGCRCSECQDAKRASRRGRRPGAQIRSTT